MSGHILILGGTAEARELAVALAGNTALRVTTSLAGRVERPRPTAGTVRVGGFGGPQGLADWLRTHAVDIVVDATHPFATTISANAAEAAAATGTALFALRRPGWTPGPGDLWHLADDLTDAAARLPGLGERVFLTTGRLGLAVFATAPGADRLHFLVRSVDPPRPPLPPHTDVLLDRGPYTVRGETELLRAHAVDVLVTKDSGGAATAAKLTAARDLGLPVVVVRRPPPPPGVPVASDVPAALRLLGAGQDLGVSRDATDRCP
ncbi:cobalt-precorrin-6A reductase [Streptomyces sp. DT24]|uniref:cobalt-precorrin-6A reductase n=1 Tax=unclassified Streptomyces TaxID=2593676 RepID=UPI0023B8FFD1|nr:cobalt-precorrin-6A reductase [Streptomyces sp. AM 4-1-1]WEH36879.1 cobalt-precorrin-6A reductase [Streptomyces sp. AM 4-1-1]